MLKKFSKLIFNLISLLDKIIFFLFDNRILFWFNDFINNNFYSEFKLNKEKIIFFTLKISLILHRLSSHLRVERSALISYKRYIKF